MRPTELVLEPESLLPLVLRSTVWIQSTLS
jgi:hypothetical protein